MEGLAELNWEEGLEEGVGRVPHGGGEGVAGRGTAQTKGEVRWATGVEGTWRSAFPAQGWI